MDGPDKAVLRGTRVSSTAAYPLLFNGPRLVEGLKRNCFSGGPSAIHNGGQNAELIPQEVVVVPGIHSEIAFFAVVNAGRVRPTGRIRAVLMCHDVGCPEEISAGGDSQLRSTPLFPLTPPLSSPGADLWAIWSGPAQ